MEYNASSIKILTEDQAIDRFDWKRAEDLSRRYNLPLDWINRGFEASRRLNISPDFFVNKYILKQDLEKNLDLERVFIDLLKEIKNND